MTHPLLAGRLGRSTSVILAGAAAFALVGCDSSTGPEDAESVAIRFSAETSGVAASATGLAAAPVSGTNGTLEITQLHVIVAELEFEGTNGTCGVDDDDDDDCFEVDLPPWLVNVPLDGSPLTVATTNLPAGSYSEFELEIEIEDGFEIEFDDDDDDDG